MRWVVAFILGVAAGQVLGSGRRRTCSPADGLTARQRQIFMLVSAGYTTKEIARRERISTSSVRTHVARALKATGAPNRAAVVALTRPQLVPASPSRSALRSSAATT